MSQIENVVSHHRLKLYDFFDEVVKPFIKESGDDITDELCDKVEELCVSKMKNSGYQYWTAKKYDYTLRLSCWLKGIGMIYFMTYTPSGKEKYFGSKYHGEE